MMWSRRSPLIAFLAAPAVVISSAAPGSTRHLTSVDIGSSSPSKLAIIEDAALNRSYDGSARIDDATAAARRHSFVVSSSQRALAGALVSFVHGSRSGIFVISSRGGRMSRVANAPGSGSYYDPAWSNDGRRLAVTVGGDRSEDVAVVVPKPRLEVSGGISCCSDQPSWAPDGARLVLVGVQFFEPYREGGLYISRPGVRSNQELTRESLDPEGTHDGSPAWSPNGTLIAFARSIGNGPRRLYVIRPNGRGLRLLTRSFGENPSWSPDGSRLVFDDEHRIAVIGVNGRNFRYLTKGPSDSDPSWSPDGRTIAFVRGQDLWLMDATGRSLRRLVRHASQPAWKRE